MGLYITVEENRPRATGIASQFIHHEIAASLYNNGLANELGYLQK